MGRKSKAAVRKKEILEHFHEVLMDEGFENASIAKIASRMDVNPSLIIHYFTTKEALVVEFVDYILSMYEDGHKEQVLSTEDPEEQFLCFINILFSEQWLKVTDQSVFYACYYLTSQNKQIRARFQAMYHYYNEIMIPLVSKWINAKVIEDNDPKTIAEYIIISCTALGYYDKLMDDPIGFQKRKDFLKRSVLTALGYQKSSVTITA